MPRVVFFDLDDTLVKSQENLAPEMIAELARLLAQVPIAIISGASFQRIEKDCLSILTPHLHNGSLFVFANNAAESHLYKDEAWELEYKFSLTDDEKDAIIETIQNTLQEIGLAKAEPPFSIFSRETKVYIAGVPLDSPQELKQTWDPGRIKLSLLKTTLSQKLPEYEVRMGGTTTIDITKKGISKAYGVEWLSKHLNIPSQEMLFIGDGFFEGGNDAVVIPTGIQTKMISGPDETLEIIESLLLSKEQNR